MGCIKEEQSSVLLVVKSQVLLSSTQYTKILADFWMSSKKTIPDAKSNALMEPIIKGERELSG